MNPDHELVPDFDLRDENDLIVERRSLDDLIKVDRIVERSRDLPEQVYEGCMHARIVDTSDSRAMLVIRFSSGLGIDRLPIHRHAHSSRKIWVAAGRGTFHFEDPRDGVIRRVVVERGTYVGFPKGLFHTFTTEESEMLVVAIHDPFQELDDPEILERSAMHAGGSESTSSTTLPIRVRLS